MAIQLKDIPVLVQIDPEHCVKANLMEELKIDIHRINRDLIQQPARYMWWCALLCECIARVKLLKEKLGKLDAQITSETLRKMRVTNKAVKITEVKREVSKNPLILALKQRIRKWENSERLLKYAEQALSQRKDVLQTYAANRREEMSAVPKVKKDREE